MKVEVSEQPTGSFSVGAGFSNLEDFVFTANVSKNNFLGLGYVMSAAVNLSKLRQQGDVSLYDPYFLDSRWTFSIHAFSISRQFIEDEYQRGGTIAIGRYLDRRDDIRLVADYTFEDTGLVNLDSYKERLFGGQLYRNGITSTAGLSLNIDKRNNRIQATRGIYTSVKAVAVRRLPHRRGPRRGPARRRLQHVRESTRTSARSTGEPRRRLAHLQVQRHARLHREHRRDDRPLHPSLPRGRYQQRARLRLVHAGPVDPGTRRRRRLEQLADALQRARRSDGTRRSPRDRRHPDLDQQLRARGTDLQAGRDSRPSIFFDAGNAFGDPWGTGRHQPARVSASPTASASAGSPDGPLRFEWGFPVEPYEDERKAVFDFTIGSLF